MSTLRKPLWKRKRWIAAATIWLLLPILYPLSIGPLFYAWYGDWISDDVVIVTYTPIAEIQERSPAIDAAMNSYVEWWFELYVRHNPERFTHPDPDYLDAASNAN